MSAAGVLELIAWLLSALIAGWLLLDMVRVGRRYSEEQLINVAEQTEEPK